MYLQLNRHLYLTSRIWYILKNLKKINLINAGDKPLSDQENVLSNILKIIDFCTRPK